MVFVLHTFGIIIIDDATLSGVGAYVVSSVPSVDNNSDVDVMSRSDWLLLSYLAVLTTATSSLWVSWCPVHISVAAVSPSTHTTVLNLKPRDHVSALRELHWLPATARIQCKLCLLLHNSLVTSCQLLNVFAVSVTAADASLWHSVMLSFRSARNSDFDVPRSRPKIGERAFCIAA